MTPWLLALPPVFLAGMLTAYLLLRPWLRTRYVPVAGSQDGHASSEQLRRISDAAQRIQALAGPQEPACGAASDPDDWFTAA